MGNEHQTGELHGFGWLERLCQDIRLGFRRLRANPGFAAATILPLALAISFTTAVFSLTDAVLYRPTGVKAPDRVAAIYGFSRSANRYLSLSYPDFRDIHSLDDLIESSTAYLRAPFAVHLSSVPELVNTELVSGDYFRTTGITPTLGRPLTAEDDSPAAPPAALISYALWENNFQRSMAILGTPIKIGNVVFTIVGVMPRDYQGMLLDWYGGTAFWLPLSSFRLLVPAIDDYEHRRQDQMFMMAARLRRGVSVPQLQAALDVLAPRIASKPDIRFTALPSSQARFFPAYRPQTVRFLELLIAACAAALLIACANLANLLLALAASRRKEIATRLAIGANRSRLVQQFLAENLSIAASASAISVPLTLTLLPFLREAPINAGFKMALNLRPDARALAAGMLVSLTTALLVSLIPAWRASRRDVAKNLRGSKRLGLRDIFAIAQVGCAMAALTACALLAESLRDQDHVRLGFDPSHVLIATVGNNGAGAALLSAVREQAPEAAYAWNALPTTLRSTMDVRPDSEPDTSSWHSIQLNWISDGYFETLRMPLLDGRGIRASDILSSQPVVVVNRTAAEQLWPGENPLGRRLRIRGQDSAREVVGVVQDSRYRPLGVDESGMPYVFLPALQSSGRRDYTLHIRTPGDPLRFLPQLRAILARLAPDAPLYDVRTLEEQVGLGLGPMRIAAEQIGAVCAVGIALALIGIFASSAYRVAQRRKEIAIRLALGATQAGVIRVFTVRGLLIGLAGGAAGIAPALWGTRLLRAAVPGTAALDPAQLIVASAILAAVATLAAWAAARQISRMEAGGVLKIQ